MRVAFRVDATIQIGAGHFMRCLSLADALKPLSTSICFISRQLPEHLQSLLANKGFSVAALKHPGRSTYDDGLTHSHWLEVGQNQDAIDTIQALAGNPCDWLVIDHYAIDHRWELKLRASTKKILVIDDLADRRHECDLLLDQNLFIDMDSRYNNKTPSHCVLLLGSRYALLRDEFVRLRKQAQVRSGRIERVLVYFGSGDANNYTSSAVQALADIRSKNLQVDVVIGMQNPFHLQIESLCKENSYLFHIQTQHMAELMMAADLAIGAGGISTYERLFLRLPAILKPVSFNQVESLNYMSHIGLFELFSTTEDLEEKLRHILKNENSSPPDCVEDGSNKLAKMMATEFTHLSSPKPFDVRRTFRWLQDNRLRMDFVITESPRRREHFDYWRKLLSDPKQRVYSIFHFGEHVGNCGLKNIDQENRKSEIWIYLANLSARGRGVAKRAVEKLLTKAKNELFSTEVYLHVVKTNCRAIQFYKNNGFYETRVPLEGRWKGRDADILHMENTL